MSFQVKYIYDLVDKMSPQLKAIQAQVQQTSAKIESLSAKTANSMQSATNSMRNFGQDLRNVGTGMLPISGSIGVAGVAALKSTANFETLQMQMEVLTGSATKGKEIFEKLKKLGAETPFELKDLAKANNTLMGYGVTADNAFKQIQLLGDVSAVTGGDLQGITVAFGQAAASGRLMGQDLLQLVNNGVPIVDMLAKSMGRPKEAIKELVSQGQVTFPVLLKAFEEATGKGGRFENGMQKLSTTLSGLYSTFKDNVNIALGEFGNELVGVLDLKNKMKAFNEMLGVLTQKFKDLSPFMKQVIVYGGLFVAVLAPALVVIGFMATGIAALTTAFTGLGVALTFIAKNPLMLVLAGLVTLYTTWDDFRVVVDAAFKAMKEGFDAASPTLKSFLKDLVLVLETLIKISDYTIGGAKKLGTMGAEFINTQIEKANPIEKLGSPIQRVNARFDGNLGITLGGNVPSGTKANYTPIRQSNVNMGVNTIFAQ